MNANVAMDKSMIDFGLFRSWGYNLPDLTLSLNQSDAFVIMQDDFVSAQCLVDNKKFFCDITHYAYNEPEDFSVLLKSLAEQYKEQSLKYIEIGCGNASLEQYTLFQRTGFRVVGVVANHYVKDDKTVEVENGIPNLDMIRFRLNLQEKTFTTLGYNASGVK